MRGILVRLLLAAVVLTVAGAVLTGCAKSTPETTEIPVDTTPPPTPPPPPPPPPPAPTPDPDAWKVGVNDVFFDYDKYDLRSDARAVLQENARMLKENPGFGLVLEGHCDERGTEQYNLALGQRRADAVRAYLIDLGVSASGLKTISYGEERPFSMGHTDSEWSQNRRVHFRFE